MDNEMISAGWWCLLLWQILISGGAFKQEGSGGGGGEEFQYVRGNYKPFICEGFDRHLLLLMYIPSYCLEHTYTCRIPQDFV